jgi:flagellar protein FlbT
MALIIDLKPSEKIVIGNSLITNDTHRARLHIEGDAPILRERDIMTEADANTPCKRIYLAIQLMYLSHDPKTLHKTYFDMVHEVQNAAPSTSLFFLKINDHILSDRYYKALKECNNLIEHEREILANV